MWRKAVPRWAGALLVFLYAVFIVGGLPDRPEWALSASR
jgi:hypothetical protein